MADLSGLIFTVLGVSFEITSIMYSYAKDVKHASKDMQQLANEIFALIGVLRELIPKLRMDRDPVTVRSRTFFVLILIDPG